MAWSDAARRAAAQARKLRSQLRPRDRREGRKALFKQTRASHEMDRIVASGGRLGYTDPAMVRYGNASRTLHQLKKRGPTAKLKARLDRAAGASLMRRR